MKRSTLKDDRTLKQYSESFKQKVILEISEGRKTKKEASHYYGCSEATIYRWIRKMNRLDLFNPKVRVEMPHENDQLKSLKQQNKELKEALVQLQLKHLRSEADLEVALEELGYGSRKDFEKKHEANRSKKR